MEKTSREGMVGSCACNVRRTEDEKRFPEFPENVTNEIPLQMRRYALIRLHKGVPFDDSFCFVTSVAREITLALPSVDPAQPQEPHRTAAWTRP